jgi:hypothetical protein
VITSFTPVCLNSLFSALQGDILFLHMSKESIRTGEIVVFNIDVSLAQLRVSS